MDEYFAGAKKRLSEVDQLGGIIPDKQRQKRMTERKSI